MKLFQNLYTGLAEEVVKTFFYLKPWCPFYSTERNGLSNFGGQSPKEHSCIFFFKIDALVKEKKSFEGFSIFSSGGHIVQRCGRV